MTFTFIPTGEMEQIDWEMKKNVAGKCPKGISEHHPISSTQSDGSEGKSIFQ